jgi:hypothetical protein
MGNIIDTFRVLAHENQAEFDQFLVACQTEFAPKTGHESFLTVLAAQARRFETIAYDYLITGEFDETNPDARIVARLPEKMKDVLTFLQRQAASAETAYHRANSELNQAHLHGLRTEAQAAKAGLSSRSAPPPFPPPAPEFDLTRATPDSWWAPTSAVDGV